MSDARPFLSVVIPTYHRVESLGRCLASLARQTYPRDRFEIIVVNDGPEDEPLGVVREHQRACGVRLINQRHAGPAAARNRGAAEAAGEYLAFTDDDCAPAPGWLAELAAGLGARAGCAVAGQAVNALPRNVYSAASQALVNYLFSYYNADPAAARFLTSNNFAMPAAGFRRIGGFDDSFPLAAAEDRDLCDRWVEGGGPLLFLPGAVVNHYHELGFRSFWRQQSNYGRGACTYHRRRSLRGGGKVRVEPPSFYFNLFLYPLRAGGERAARVAALFVVAQVANVCGYFRERLRGE
jgi:GT2 family glycosyltransferase